MRVDWLWDRKTDILKVKSILRDPSQEQFLLFASLLLSRKNNPKEVFKDYLDPFLFCSHWNQIKKRMRQDKWSQPRIIFWQAIYEKLIEKYKSRGAIFRQASAVVKGPLCAEIGSMIRDLRRSQRLSQQDLASKLKVSQQLISRIEKGQENVSIGTLTNVARALGKKPKFELV